VRAHAAALTLLLVAACDPSPAPGKQQLANKRLTAKRAKAQPARALQDRSIAVREYVAAGLPSPDRDWTGEDFRRAALVLAPRSDHLPRHGSARSGQLFDRIASDKNLAPLREKSVPLQTRLPGALQYMQGLNTIAKIYIDAFAKRQVADRDVVELLRALMRLTEVMFDLVDEFLPTLDKTDPQYAVRLKGLEKMKRGSANVVFGALDSVTETARYHTAERVRLMGYILEIVPRIAPRLDRSVQQKLRVTARRLETDTALRPQAKKLLAALPR